MREPTTSTLTFVFTDIEGSTRLLRDLGDDFALVLREHDGIIARATAAAGGESIRSEGDGHLLAFVDAAAAIAAAVQAQRELSVHPWPDSHPVRVRMGIHSGAVLRDPSGFVGMALHEAARLAAAGHGGQVLLSPATVELAAGRLPDGVDLDDLGAYRFKDIEQPMRVRQLRIEGLPTDFPPLRASAGPASRLPQQLTTFVDRHEVEALVGLSRSCRLMTLTGPGGTGKTRLALEVAARIAPAFSDGAWFVPLDAVREAELVPSEMATVLGLDAGTEAPIDRLTSHLAPRSLLLVLDNLEQVIEARVAIARILAECPDVAVMATSRIPLGIYGEQEFPVPPLAVPAASGLSVHEVGTFESVALFVERARAARPSFELNVENAALVSDILVRLDGLPLAIELAAARLRMLPLPALRTRLDHRLGELGRGASDRPDRQRTLRGAISWSRDLLEEPERRLFARLGAIAGTASLELIETVTGPDDEIGRTVFDALESLTQQSLVRVVDDDAEEARYTMLATIREFATECLDASDEGERIRRRHAQAYLALAEAAGPEAIGPDAAHWNEQLEHAHDDLRAVLRWSIANDDAEVGLRLIVALWRFWQVRGHLHEADHQVHAILALPSVAAQQPELLARAQAAAGGIAYWRSDGPATRQHYEAALGLARQTQDKALLADALLNVGFSPLVSEDHSTDHRPDLDGASLRQARELFEELGDQQGVARASWAQGIEAAMRDDIPQARALGEESLEAARAVGDVYQTGWSLHLVAMGDLVVGDNEAASRRLGEALALFEDAGDRSASVLMLLDAALVARYRGWASDAWRLLGAEERLRTRTGADIGALAAEFQSLDDRRLPATDQERAWFDAGSTLTTAEAMELARQVAERTPTE